MKQTNKLSFFAIIAIVLVTFFSSCSKENDTLPHTEPYLSFNSVEEYNATLTKVLAMTEEQRLAWEKQQGFTSFATKSNEAYMNIAEKELTIDELKKEIVKYNNLLSLKSDTNSDYVLEHALESTPKRFLCNANRIFKIGNTLYKVFEDNIVMCNEKHYTKLLSLNESNYIEYTGDNFQLMFDNKTLKDDAYNVPFNGVFLIENGYRHIIERRNDNGSNRTRIRVYFDQIAVTDYNNVIISWNIKTTFDAAAYKRVLGIWYTASRTISCNIKIKYDYRENTLPWVRTGTFSYSNSGTNTSEIRKVFETFESPYPYQLGPDRLHFAALDCWADTPDTGRAEIIWNTELF